MRTFIALLAFILLTSCGGQKRPIVNTVSTIDSTYTTKQIRKRDTIISVPFYKIGVSAPVGDLNETPVTKSNGRASVNLWRLNDTIYANAVCDSLELEIELLEETITTLRERRTDTVKTLPPVEVKYIPWYIEILAWAGGLLFIFLGYKLIKLIIKLNLKIPFLK